MRRWLVGLSAALGVTSLVFACTPGTDCDFGLCAGPAVGTDGGDAADAISSDATPPGCDPSKEQKSQAACLNDDFSIFVSPLGKPDSPGTKTAPVNTLGHAIELAVGMKQRIYVCDATYDERVSLKVPVNVYGGLSCDGGTWKASNGHPVFGKTQETGFALDVKAAGSFELVDLEFSAAAGSAANPNSIAARVTGSPGLVMKRVSLTAHQGLAGGKGDAGTTGVRTPSDGKGNPGTTGGGGPMKACTCTTGGVTTGGTGGGPANGSGVMGSGDVVGTSPTDGLGGPGGITTCIGGIGHEGGSASAQTPAAVAKSLGTVTDGEWVPALGVDGTPGVSGQGGGGGGANNGGGGGGGCGGCGGSGGKGGHGGGASVALLTIDSPIKLQAMTMNGGPAGKGGPGGVAGSGGTPGFGGDPGSGGVGASGCSGGQGGSGGDGGHGSGGPGGISVGVLYNGTTPLLDSGSTVNQTGPLAPGGDPAAAGANAGPAGKQLASADASKL